MLDFASVDKWYGAYHALRGVSFRLQPGTIGLLGPNGAGKTTLLRVLLGLEEFSGEARVLGCDARRDARVLRQKVGFMPESDCYLTGFNALETCVLAARLSGLPGADAIARAHSVLDFVGLGDKRYQLVANYSTGQKQRAKLAMALVHDPELLLLDEPTSGLDPKGREEMLALIGSLHHRTGASVILSSHLLPDIEQTSDQVLLLGDGEVIYQGSLGRLREESGRDVYEVRTKDRIDTLVAELKKAGLSVEREGELALVRVTDASTDLIFATAQKLTLQIRHLQPRRLTLEHAFRRALASRASRGSVTA